MMTIACGILAMVSCLVGGCGVGAPTPASSPRTMPAANARIIESADKVIQKATALSSGKQELLRRTVKEIIGSARDLGEDKAATAEEQFGRRIGQMAIFSAHLTDEQFEVPLEFFRVDLTRYTRLPPITAEQRAKAKEAVKIEKPLAAAIEVSYADLPEDIRASLIQGYIKVANWQLTENVGDYFHPNQLYLNEAMTPEAITAELKKYLGDKSKRFAFQAASIEQHRGRLSYDAHKKAMVGMFVDTESFALLPCLSTLAERMFKRPPAGSFVDLPAGLLDRQRKLDRELQDATEAEKKRRETPTTRPEDVAPAAVDMPRPRGGLKFVTAMAADEQGNFRVASEGEGVWQHAPAGQ